MEVYKDGFLFKKSKRQNKKYDVYKNNRFIISFGDNRYEHYKDKIGIYKSLDHGDKKRRDNYYARHGKESRYGSAKYFSHKYLW
jgi:hypothetical protein